MIKIEKFIPGGQALGTDKSGKKIFFWNALPGEEVVEYEITKNKSHYAEAIATKIKNQSDHRVQPRDDCFLSTSPWQILDYHYELSEKQSLVVEMFREHGIDIPTPEISTDGHDYHYRNKMEYALYWDKDTGKISPAFHARGSHRKVPITKSSIERPELFNAAVKIIADLNARHEEARKYQSLLLRCNQAGEVSGGLYENGKPHPTFPNLTDTILGHEYSYSPNGFFQINLPVYEMALTEIKKHITTDKVLDLYAGVGTIGLSVARDRELTLVEVDKAAYGELVKNCNKNESSVDAISQQSAGASSNFYNGHGRAAGTEIPGQVRLTRCKNDDCAPRTSRNCISDDPIPILAKSEDVTSFLRPDQTVILDPPRAGCDIKLLDKILETKPHTIIYLSCNPATQARDVKILQNCYKIIHVQTFNFFPHTPHIENLIVLSL